MTYWEYFGISLNLLKYILSWISCKLVLIYGDISRQIGCAEGSIWMFISRNIIDDQCHRLNWYLQIFSILMMAMEAWSLFGLFPFYKGKEDFWWMLQSSCAFMNAVVIRWFCRCCSVSSLKSLWTFHISPHFWSYLRMHSIAGFWSRVTFNYL